MSAASVTAISFTWIINVKKEWWHRCRKCWTNQKTAVNNRTGNNFSCQMINLRVIDESNCEWIHTYIYILKESFRGQQETTVSRPKPSFWHNDNIKQHIITNCILYSVTANQRQIVRQFLSSCHHSQAQVIHDYRRWSQPLFTPLLSHSAGEAIMFSGCPSTAFVHSFVQTDLVTTISQEWIEQISMELTQNIH